MYFFTPKTDARQSLLIHFTLIVTKLEGLQCNLIQKDFSHIMNLVIKRKEGKMSSNAKVIDVTYQLFCQYGDHLSLSQVAKELGIKKQSLYNYFASKDELIQAMLTLRIDRYYKSIIVFFDDAGDLSAKDQLYNYGLFVIKYHTNPEIISLRRWITVSPTYKNMDVLHELIYDYRLRYNNILTQLLNNCIESATADDKTMKYALNLYNTGILGIIISLNNPALNSDLEEFYDQFFDTFWSIVTQNKKSTQ